MTLVTINKDKFFRGGANIAPDPDAGKELGELIYDIQVALNLVEHGIVDGDFAGTFLGRMTRTGAGAYVIIKDNLAAAVAPVVGDDDADDYSVGSLWFDTTAHRMYICTDASTGAAIWIGMVAKNNVAAVAPTVAADDALGYSVGSVWTDTVTGIVWLCQDASTGAAVWNPVVKNNLAAAADPTVNEDTGDGYAVGSVWINTTAVPPRVFQCTDATTAAAVWRQINMLNNMAAAVAPAVGDDDTGGYDVGSIWFDTTADIAYICLDNATGAAVWRILATQQILENYQGAAATATLRVFRALVAGHITHTAAETGTVAAAGESMTFDVQIGGVTCLTGLITVDNGVAVDTPEAGVIDPAANAFVAGDLIYIVRTYVAGGGPTPMRDTAIGIEIRTE